MKESIFFAFHQKIVVKNCLDEISIWHGNLKKMMKMKERFNLILSNINWEIRDFMGGLELFIHMCEIYFEIGT